MVGLLLARQAITLIPAPINAGTRADLERAASMIPRYRELMDRLSWSRPLFVREVASSHVGGDDALADVRRMWGRIESEEDWTPLRSWMRWSLAEEPEQFLDALCLDMLRGGPDPGISVPVAAGSDHYASRFGLVVARAHPKSLAQRAEMAFARSIVSWTLPCLLQADAERVLHVRESLSDELDGVRVAVESAIAGHADADNVRAAARAYTERFAEQEQELLLDVGDDVRPIAGAVSLTLVAMPPDVALRSSADAAAAVGGARARKAHRPGDVGNGDEVLSLLVKVLGRDGTKSTTRRASVGGR